jgi:acylphosphatase
MSVERRTIVFSGRVQGVGFRMTAAGFAQSMAVSGTVRNLSDGRLELVAEGEAAEIDRLVERLREHFGSFVRTVNQTPSAAGGSMAPGIRVTD